MIASGLLCQILSNPESTYRKVSLKEEDNPLKMADYKHKWSISYDLTINLNEPVCANVSLITV